MQSDEQSQELHDKAKNTGKKAGKQIGKKVGKAVKKFILTFLKKVIALLIPPLIIGLILFFVYAVAYYVVYESRGAVQSYDYRLENKVEFQEDKNFLATNSTIQDKKTTDIQRFYQYMSQQSFYQIITDDNELLDKDDEDQEPVVDFEGKEKNYFLSANFLFAMDELLHQKKFIYPEQLVEPVHYDKEKLELKDVVDENGNLITTGEVWNLEGKKEEEERETTSAWGLGSIFKYEKDKRTLSVEGEVTARDQWNPTCKCVQSVPLATPEPFAYVMDGFPIDIWKMTKAVTFTGEYEFTYEMRKKSIYGFSDTVGKQNEPATKVHVGVYEQYELVEKTRTEYNEETGEGDIVTYWEEELVATHDLYEYRSGSVMEEAPATIKTDFNDKGRAYLYNYIRKYETFLPQSVMTEFDIFTRLGDDTEYFFGDIETGGSVGSGAHGNAMQYLPIATQYGTMYGVDPLLIIAVIAQESGGNAKASNGGLMQVQLRNGVRTISALNLTTGVKDTITATSQAELEVPDTNIRLGTMFLANLITGYNGSVLKGLQAYNFGSGTLSHIQKKYPTEWENDTWLGYREWARLEQAPGTQSASYACIPQASVPSGSLWGDSCYVENVLRYYGGSGILGQQGSPEDYKENIFKTIWDTIGKIFSGLAQKYDKDEAHYPYKHHVTEFEIETYLNLAQSMEDYTYLSQINGENVELTNFWQKGAGAVGGGGGGNFEGAVDGNGFQSPLNVSSPRITSYPGNRYHPVNGSWHFHLGTDIAVPSGTPVYAIGDGKVIEARNTEPNRPNASVSYGNYIKIQHPNGLSSTYAHLSQAHFKVGDTVTRGQEIGLSGNTGNSTGPHLHFEIRKGSAVYDSSVLILGGGGEIPLAP